MLIETRKLDKAYGQRQVLHGIDLSIRKGEVVSLIGPSGSGKSTLLRCLNGLEEITGGEIIFQGAVLSRREKDWQAVRKEIGMVFQSYDLFPDRTVLENLTIGPMMVKKVAKEAAEATARQWLQRVGLAEYADSYPRALSGGQKQRVAIIRSLCMDPELILLDEITASLDPEMVREVLEVILDLAKSDTTMFIVTHEMAFARQVSDRIIFMAEGRILEENVAEEFFQHPQTERAQAFIQSLDFTHL